MRSSLAAVTPSERGPDDQAAARYRAMRAWQQHGIVAITPSDERLTPYEAQVIRNVAARLFGERRA